jgi:hypothetical protein
LSRDARNISLIKFMFFQNGTNLDELGKNWESMVKLIMEKSEKEIIQTVLYKINSLYCGDPMIQHFLYSIKKHRKEIFLYLDNPDVEKTSDKSEQCTVSLNSGQFAKRIMIHFLPFHLLFVLSYLFPSLILLPSPSLIPLSPGFQQDFPCNTVSV